MRSPFKGAVCRRLVGVALAITAVGLVAVPVALAANPSMTLYGVVYAKYYGGQRALAATVTVPNPTPTESPLATTQASADGLFLTTVAYPLPTYTGALTVTATALSPQLTDWSKLFSTGTASFEFSDGAVVGVPITFTVKNTTVRGTVTTATTKKALKGVKVTVASKSVLTVKRGKYALAIGLWPATKYRVKFAKKGFYSVVKTFSSAPGASVPVNVRLKAK